MLRMVSAMARRARDRPRSPTSSRWTAPPPRSAGRAQRPGRDRAVRNVRGPDVVPPAWTSSARLDLPAGEHTLIATADTGARVTRRFTTVAGEPRWAVLNHWGDFGKETGALELTLHDEPVAFG